MHLVSFAVFYLVTCITSTLASGSAAIISPANGTSVAPGARFPFEYQSLADYGASSYNLTIWASTKPASSFWSPDDGDDSQGYFFGRFGVPNYPGNPRPHNPLPRFLTMPDFSKPLGGFGVGMAVNDVPMYLLVAEEYGDGSGSLGYKFSVVSSVIIYNASSEA